MPDKSWKVAERRDRELLERNRASVGVSSLSTEELAKWGYEPEDVTPVGGGGAT